MPDFHSLKAGDRIRLLSVPAHDLAQRKEELQRGVEMAGWTADTIEQIIEQCPVVEISRVDEYGHPWFECDVMTSDGVERHTLNISDNESWESV